MAPYLNRINHFMQNICRFAYICGVSNFWYKDLDLPKSFTKFYNIFSIVIGIVFMIVQTSSVASFAYDMGLSEKQRYDRFQFTPMLIIMAVAIIWGLYFRDSIRHIQQRLTDEFPSVYLDEESETAILFKINYNAKAFIAAAVCLAPVYACEGLIYSYESGTGFAVPVTHWPTLHNHSVIANIGRVIIFSAWALYIIKITGTYLVAITTTICMSFQFINLQSYFRNLNEIFEETIGQSEKNEKYELRFIEGIKLHVKALQCARDVQRVFNAMYSGQVLVNTWVITLMMVQVATMERNLASFATILASTCICLSGTGMMMCHAGDITLEASGVSIAMYESGWQNVRGRAAARRVGFLLTVAIARAQMPLDMTALFIIKMNYESYLSLVKAAYSIFSVIL